MDVSRVLPSKFDCQTTLSIDVALLGMGDESVIRIAHALSMFFHH